jgi:hypothetical protein
MPGHETKAAEGGVEARLMALEAALRLALGEATRMGFDEPSADAAEHASRILELLVRADLRERAIDIAIGEDGTIEITVASERTLATVDVSPSGRDVALVLRDVETSEITGVPSSPSEAAVVGAIERAA